MKPQFIKHLNIVRLFAIASIAAFASFNTVAQEKPVPGELAITVMQPQDKELKFTIFVANPERKRVSLKITNKTYGTIEHKVFWTNEYGMICNLIEAADGLYNIEVRSRNKLIKKTIEINTVTVSESNRLVSFVSPH